MKQQGEKVTWCIYKRPPMVFPIYIPSKVEKKVSAAILLMKMKRGMETFVTLKGIRRKPECSCVVRVSVFVWQSECVCSC
jgi:hypothetical protein